MLHYIAIIALLITPASGWSAAESACSKGCVLKNLAKLGEQQQLAYQKVTLTSLVVTNTTGKTLTLTFRVPFTPTCELPSEMCKILIVQKLESKIGLTVKIPTVWETVEITDECAGAETHNIAGRLVTVPWKHHGRYAKTDVSPPLEELTFTRNASGHIVLYKSGILVPEASRST